MRILIYHCPEAAKGRRFMAGCEVDGACLPVVFWAASDEGARTAAASWWATETAKAQAQQPPKPARKPKAAPAPEPEEEEVEEAV